MPLPAATPLCLPLRCLALLRDIARQQATSFRLVARAQLWLACLQGTPLKVIARKSGRDRNNVRSWYRRWDGCAAALARAEAAGGTDAELRQLLLQHLSDQPRQGAPPTFTAEQIVQLIALACEDPAAASQRPISHWTPRELAAEAIQRGIVKTISPTSVGRFLKSGGITTASRGVLDGGAGFRETRVRSASGADL